MADALSKWALIQDRFAAAYRGLIGALVELQRPIAVCTIYYPARLDDNFQPEVAPALSIFNDVILKAAFENHLPVVETRLVCNEDSDYVYFIELSETGGAKIAEALVNASGLRPASPGSQVFGG